VTRSRAGKQFCTHCLARFKTKQIYKSPFDDEVFFCSLDCLVVAVETYLVYESKLDFRKLFPGKLRDVSNQLLLPLRLITQKHPQYFQDKLVQPRERFEQYGCGSDFSTVEGYPCVESMVTHYDQQSVPQRLGLAINAIILYHCLCAMEYLPSPIFLSQSSFIST
jgi:hypothetical protein